jgi:hypothetical protein
MNNLARPERCCCECGADAASEQGGMAQENVTFGSGLEPVPGGATESRAAIDCCGCDWCDGC